MSTKEDRHSVQIIINASPDTLYRHLVDFRNHIAWNHSLVEVKQTTPDPIQVGTVFEAKEQAPTNFPALLKPIVMFLLRIFVGRPESRAEITQLEPNRTIGWLAQSPIEGKPDMQMKWQLTFAPHEDGTQITQQFEMFPQSRLTRTFTNDNLKRQVAEGCLENLGKFKTLVEDDGILDQGVSTSVE